MGKLIIENIEKTDILNMYGIGTETHIIDENKGKAASNLLKWIGKGIRKSSKARKAARAAGKPSQLSNYINAARAGRRATPWTRQIFSRYGGSSRVGNLVRYLSGNPLPKGVFRQIRRDFGLGPAFLAVGVGLLKQYVGLVVLISSSRSRLSVVMPVSLTVFVRSY